MYTRERVVREGESERGVKEGVRGEYGLIIIRVWLGRRRKKNQSTVAGTGEPPS